MIFNHYLDVEDEFGTKYSVLLSKTYESEKELVPEKKGKVRVTGFKQFVAIVDTPKGLITPFLYFWARWNRLYILMYLQMTYFWPFKRCQVDILRVTNENVYLLPQFFYNLTNKYFRMQNVHAQCWPTWWKYSKEFDKLGSQKGNSKLSWSIEKSLQSDNRISLRLC